MAIIAAIDTPSVTVLVRSASLRLAQLFMIDPSPVVFLAVAGGHPRARSLLAGETLPENFSAENVLLLLSGHSPTGVN
jgi:hypothetical protein